MQAMIYPDQITANMLATKLQETQGAQYTVAKVTLGYQVCRITPCPPHMPPAKPQEGRAVRPGNGMVPRLFANAQKPAIDGDIGAGRGPSIV
jgi:hypothetical protein